MSLPLENEPSSPEPRSTVNITFACDNHIFLTPWFIGGILIVTPNIDNSESVSFHHPDKFIHIVESQSYG